LTESDCTFCRIGRGEIPADVVHQDEDLLAFRDIDPKAPTHILIISRKHIESVGTMDDEDQRIAGRLVLAARDIARRENLTDSGFRIVANTGNDGGQSVQHLHFHLLGGRALRWPPG
jgi:histidine triad (HIT) family protein